MKRKVVSLLGHEMTLKGQGTWVKGQEDRLKCSPLGTVEKWRSQPIWALAP